MASWDMLREFDNLRREVDEAVRGAGLARPFGSTFLAPITTQRFPLVNVSEDDVNLYIAALLPGVDPKTSISRWIMPWRKRHSGNFNLCFCKR